ncbi:MAG: hypothetical protein NW205_07875 [Hyphomicrobiaceae bacterium]|nr:hypothetical protein [Hyphomicrobiaceae bacterium]
MSDHSSPARKRITHLRQILLWPIELISADGANGCDGVTRPWVKDLVETPGTPWAVLDDEFGEPDDFQERHYNEFVSFLPPVQRFLYGQPFEGLRSALSAGGGKPGKPAGKTAATSAEAGGALAVLRRRDIRSVRVTLDQGRAPLTLHVAHVDLHLYDDMDIAVLAVEVYADDVDFDTGLETLFRFGRAYPAYWEDDGRGGHCPWLVEWLGADQEVLSASDYQNATRYLSFVCENRSPAISAHWEFMLRPLSYLATPTTKAASFRQLEYYRMPYMVYVALPDPKLLTRAELVRLALGTASGDGGVLPYSSEYLSDFENRFCYNRYVDEPGQALPMGLSEGIRFMATGNTLIALGSDKDRFFTSNTSGFLSRFRHQHFLLFLIAHLQKAGLRLFSDRLIATASKLEAGNEESAATFRRTMRLTHEHFLRFAQRAWFHEITNQAQMRELFAMTRRHLELEPLFREIREELQDMVYFLDMDAMRRQNETVMRLTVVTTFGLMGTVATGLLGMNVIDWGQEPLGWRIGMFLAFLAFVVFLTLYTVAKSRRLSELLDAIADEDATLWQRTKALFGVWFGKPPQR